MASLASLFENPAKSGTSVSSFPDITIQPPGAGTRSPGAEVFRSKSNGKRSAMERLGLTLRIKGPSDLTRALRSPSPSTTEPPEFDFPKISESIHDMADAKKREVYSRAFHASMVWEEEKRVEDIRKQLQAQDAEIAALERELAQLESDMHKRVLETEKCRRQTEGMKAELEKARLEAAEALGQTLHFKRLLTDPIEKAFDSAVPSA
eukprot:comp19111_c0_seq1/m.21707 comp19111_c0_seq1/g.21707  ORF comp19111_c0_seq1/g.21707 comp19111_c0_seq1/m.21707 type:complete len:207 (-) comp19111_c0_seq1:510-1130(-)